MPAWKKVITSGSDASLNTLQLTNLGSQNETLIVGTANQVTSSNILSLDTTNNRVGIGTASPAYQVEIENTGANALLVLQRTDGASCFIEGQSARSAFGSVGATPLALAYNSFAVVTIGENGAITVNPDGDGFTFPTTDGSANQVLQTDGNGTLSFADVAGGGGSSVWYDGTTYITSSADVQITGSLQIYKSGSTVFNIEGSQGTLFTVTDVLSGSLFSVNDISGIPIFEVFSDDTVKIGTYNAEAIIVNGSSAIISGSFSGSFQGDGSGLTGIVSSSFASDLPNNLKTYKLELGVSSTSAITTGAKGRKTIPYTGTIVGWRLVADQSSTVQLDVWKTNNAIPTVSDSIVASAYPALTAAELNSSTTLTGWTTSVSPDDVFILNVDSNDNATYLALELDILLT